METVSVPLQRHIFEKLQRLATPLVDDANSVIERLIAHWERSGKTSGTGQPMQTSTMKALVWHSSRGEAFPVGIQLRGSYLGKTYQAKVTPQGIEFNGKFFDNPSSAGIAVKRSAGTRGRAASTNGWEFWEMLSPENQRWVSIDVLRSKTQR